MSIKMSLNKLGTASDRKAVCLLSALLFLLLLTGTWCSDPHFLQLNEERRLSLLCLALIPVQACLWGILRHYRILTRYLSLICLPFLWMAADFVNFTFPSKMPFLSAVYHYSLAANLIMLLKMACLEIMPSGRITRRLAAPLFLLLELVLWAVPLAFMLNRWLCGFGILTEEVIAICQTHPQEAWDYFFEDNKGALILAIFLPVLCLLAFALAGLQKKALEHKLPLRFIPAFAAVIIPIAVVSTYCDVTRYTPPRFYSLAKTPAAYYREIQAYRQMVSQRQEVIRNLKTTADTGGNDGIFILIIGESLNRNYMSAYGYEKDTTPFQKKLRTQDNAFFFQKPYSSHCLTALTVPMMLTVQNQYMTPEEQHESTASLSIIDLANACGYHTAWLSNQEKLSENASIISALANAAKETVFVRAFDFQEATGDEKLVDILAQKEPLPDRTLLILHLIGSHRPYKDRAPRTLNCPKHFTSYEKSVLYNDKVIEKLMKLMEGQKLAAVFYASDHSENIDKGHNPAFFTPELTEIPTWVYLAPKYAKNNPKIVQQLRQACERPFTNDLMFNLMVDIMNLNIPFVQKKYSPLNQDFILKQRKPTSLHGKITLQ